MITTNYSCRNCRGGIGPTRRNCVDTGQARPDGDHEVAKLRDLRREPCLPCHLHLRCWLLASLPCSAAAVRPLRPRRRRACWTPSGGYPTRGIRGGAGIPWPDSCQLLSDLFRAA
jgi:hypothetical protein